MMVSVRVEHISKHYGRTKVLDDICFTVDKGELFGILGPDGSGKTTLFRILTTLLLPDKGSAVLEGKDVVKDYRDIRKLTGYMPGRFSLYQDLTVEENISFFATIFGTSLDRNYELVKPIYSQIEPFRKRKAGALSGGMKQKLALSCALIHKPEILILDEPTTGVDAVSRKEFWEMLKNLKKAEITILVSTPYMDEADLCDRVALIQNGKFLLINAPGNIPETFKDQLFAISATNMYKLINDMKEYEFTKTVYPFGRSVHYTDKRKQVSIREIEKYLKEKGNKQVSVHRIKAGIEDCFMELMKS